MSILLTQFHKLIPVLQAPHLLFLPLEFLICGSHYDDGSGDDAYGKEAGEGVGGGGGGEGRGKWVAVVRLVGKVEVEY